MKIYKQGLFVLTPPHLLDLAGPPTETPTSNVPTDHKRTTVFEVLPRSAHGSLIIGTVVSGSV